MNGKIYKFEAVIEPVLDRGGAYVRVPFDIKNEFGKGRVKVSATFNDIPYSGSIVNIGVKTPQFYGITYRNIYLQKSAALMNSIVMKLGTGTVYKATLIWDN